MHIFLEVFQSLQNNFHVMDEEHMWIATSEVTQLAFTW